MENLKWAFEFSENLTRVREFSWRGEFRPFKGFLSIFAPKSISPLSRISPKIRYFCAQRRPIKPAKSVKKSRKYAEKCMIMRKNGQKWS